MKTFIYLIILIVVTSIIAGFFIVGSPKEERLRRFDERRIGDLQFIQSEIVNYWQNKGDLPLALEDLKDDIRGVVVPVDPESSQSYKYERYIHELKFRLCGVFSLPSLGLELAPKPAYPGDYYGAENWEHIDGEVCFERTIDPDLYKPRIK